MPSDALLSSLGEAARRLLPRGRVLVAASGGGDSTALAGGLVELAAELGVEVALGHVDHGLREGSAADAGVARALAARLGAPFGVRKVSVPPGRGGLEERARTARYAALAELAAELGCLALVTGHTRDDQAETVLLRLVRGAGTAGLAGIPESTPLRALAGPGAPDVPVVRPLLGVSRAETRAWCAGRGFAFADDPTNHEPRFARNRLRAEVMPRLASLNPRASEALARAARHLAADERLLSHLAARALADATDAGGTSVAALLALPEPLRRRALRQLYAAARGDERRLSERHILSLERALSATGPHSVDLPGALVVAVAYGKVRVEEGEPESGRHEPPAPETPLRIDGPGAWTTRFGELSVSEGAEPRALVVDVVRAPLPWTLRPRAPGDRFHPLGAPGSRKLKAFLIDARIPRAARASLSLVVDRDGRVVWIVGLRASQAAAPPWERPMSLRFGPPTSGTSGASERPESG